MDSLHINKILNREEIENDIIQLLHNYNEKCKDINFKRGIYIYGSPGCGKTHFVVELLKKLNYDVIKYDAGDVRNKSLIDTITSNNVSNYNVLNMMNGVIKNIAIVMDEIDGMNNGDKGGITSLIKIIRQKKTKKQKAENVTTNPIICIGNYFVDKKIKELMKVCHVFELETPSQMQIKMIIEKIMPNIVDNDLKVDILNYIQGDMRKISFINNIYTKKPEILTRETIHNIFHMKSSNDDAKSIVKTLFKKKLSFDDHNTFMNETDRTTVALLWHENVVDHLEKFPKEVSFPFYLKILDNICFADYVDRITFQNQIWIFNEMSSLMKTFYNNKLYHHLLKIQPASKSRSSHVHHNDEIRFTKVLTKYSTEYNNILFVFMLCQELDMDRKDMISFFQELRLYYGDDFFNKSDKLNDAEKIFGDMNISKLDIKRIYRYLDKNVKKDVTLYDESDDDE
jgi:DNA polymerase III delta prime subunit